MMRKALVIAGTLLWAAAAARAQQSFDLWQDPPVAEYQYEPAELPEVQTSVTLLGRVLFPGGTEFSETGADYDDVFDPGWGGGIEIDAMVPLPQGWWAGGYIGGSLEGYEGREDVDDFGDSLEPDDLRVYSVIAGLKGRQHFGRRFFWDARIGLGVSHYSSVDGDFVIGGVPLDDQEVIDETTSVAFETGFRVGMGSEAAGLALGFGFRVQGSPNRGSDVTSVIDPETMVPFYFEAGFWLRF